jgi:imidazole glycerol-phosphate synthase subunit HisH
VIAVVDYGIGNLHSAHKALIAVGADAFLTSDPGEIDSASAVVLPGVGAFGACMNALRERGLEAPVRSAALSQRPFLGICVGMQMLFEGSEEDPSVSGLGIIPGQVKWIPPGVKRPQMQWNILRPVPSDAGSESLWDGLGAEPWMYFVHSLHGVPTDPQVVVATCEYGGVLNAAFRYGSVFATQFHPEKSGPAGLRMLSNFVEWAQVEER